MKRIKRKILEKNSEGFLMKIKDCKLFLFRGRGGCKEKKYYL